MFEKKVKINGIKKRWRNIVFIFIENSYNINKKFNLSSYFLPHIFLIQF